VEALAEGFLGVDRFDGDSTADGDLTAWARAADLDGVFRLRVSGAAPRTESSLSTFFDPD
jgi:hypothetical protein